MYARTDDGPYGAGFPAEGSELDALTTSEHRPEGHRGGAPSRDRAPTDRWKGAGIAAAIALIGVAHYATEPTQVQWHVVYQDLCYVPILLAAYWFGIRGGIAAAFLAAAGTALHFHSGWRENRPFVLSQYGQAVAFVITGAIGGALAGAERRARNRREQALAALETAHQELRASHEQLVRADRLSSLGELAAGLAHEIGNPLGGVKGAIEILASRATEGSPEAEFTALAQRELARIEGLIEDFLDYARPHEPRMVAADMFDILDRAASLLSRQATDHKIALVIARAPLPQIYVDPEQILQVFLNVLLNAVQASRPGSTVTASGRLADAWIVVDVRDEGPGMSPDAQRRMFEPFFSTKAGGTGLGLAISQRIVLGHGGRIEIVQPERGTIVRMILPSDAPRARHVS